MSEKYDYADVDEIEQSDELPPQAVAVCVKGPVLVDQAPTTLGYCESRTLVLGASPVRVLNADGRRARVTLWALSDDVIIARTSTECSNGVGAHLSGGLGTPYVFGFRDELWACVDPSSGTQDAILSVVTEQWTR